MASASGHDDSPHSVVNLADEIGEGPTWDSGSQSLLWVDILAKAVHRYSPASGNVWSRQFGQQVGAVVRRSRGGLLLALEDGFWIIEDDQRAAQRFAAVEADNPTTRMNDGKCDRAGRFWAGTMAHDASPLAGALYRLDPDGSVVRALRDITISNGIDWSPDNRTMYYIDSATHRVDAFDYDINTGEAANRRTAFAIPREAGLPDGMAIDEEGLLWIAMYEGWCVRRYRPTGELDRIVKLPVSHVTSCAFGGEDLGDLFVTTGRSGLTAQELTDQNEAGALFRVRPAVRGLPSAAFAG
jgi:sugar lactone lactonase YvrE